VPQPGPSACVSLPVPLLSAAAAGAWLVCSARWWWKEAAAACVLLAGPADGRRADLQGMMFLFVFLIPARRGRNVLPTLSAGCLTARQNCLSVLGVMIFSKRVLLEQMI